MSNNVNAIPDLSDADRLLRELGDDQSCHCAAGGFRHGYPRKAPNASRGVRSAGGSARFWGMNTHRLLRPLFALTALALLSGCGADPQPASAPAAEPPAAADTAATTVPTDDPQGEFLAALGSHCGQSFAGRIIANEPAEADDAFAGKALVMHVRECGSDTMRIPFHVGDDHSRTWVLTRTDSGLRLKHDHRHEDGSEDLLTQYGGHSAAPGSARRQEFPVDRFSIDLFEAEGRQVSTTNTWAIEIEPGQRYLYELSRPSGRLFQVEFDLTTPVPNPPTPWGHPPLPGDAGSHE
jgi:hypothetical protein